MDLYQKKNKVSNEVIQRLNDEYKDSTNNPPKRYKKNQIKGETIESTSKDKIQNRPQDKEDLPGNEKNQKNMKYVIQLGKNKENPEREEKYLHPNKSAYLFQNEKEGSIPYPEYENYKVNPNMKMSKRPQITTNNNRFNKISDNPRINQRGNNDYNNQPKRLSHARAPYRANNRYNDTRDDEYYDNRPNYVGIESSQNEFEISSINDEERVPIKNTRSPEPRVPPQIRNILSNRYLQEEKKSRYQDPRTRNIEGPRLKKQRFVDSRITDDDEIDNLIQIIEDLKSNIKDQKQQIRNLKIDNIKKDKEISYLNNELDNLQKDIEDKKIEQEKEIEDIFKNDTEENIPKLKNAYVKLLQDYDNNINDYNALKDDYNKIVDEYNKIKNDKNNAKDQADRALEDYNSIVDDYNKLDKDYKKCKNNLDLLKNENDRLKRDYERVRLRSKGKQPETKNEEEYNKLNDDYDKLNEDYNKLNEDYNKVKEDYDDINNGYAKLKEENSKLKMEMEDLHNKDEEYDNIYQKYNNLNHPLIKT